MALYKMKRQDGVIKIPPAVVHGNGLKISKLIIVVQRDHLVRPDLIG